MITVAPKRRIVAAVGIVAGVTLALTGCSSGQVSQMSTQVAAVNGAPANKGAIALRNVHIAYADPADPKLNKKNGEAVLAFLAINQSEEYDDTLLEIAPIMYEGEVIGEAELTPATAAELKPQHSIYAVQKQNITDDKDAAALREITPALQLASVKITNLTRDLSPGLTVDVTFKFERAGEIKMHAPIDAGETPRSEASTIIADRELSGSHGGSGSDAEHQGGEHEDGGH
ncbi:hypothetical protein [Antrihabitans sp. YC2-6]|uniref:hypothetical protein n=1 Tax=Antrihabitans sp. YC2-6 TaxID=2799498 RepID=UPI0018F6FC4A|nr:hypothetical protein [Antrihabitans sp. YC2-6]MBJ8345934.1 hypothetical protein [Antrihabitans sp. YC2-6]